MTEEACQDLLKSCISFGGILEGCNEKKWESNRKGSIVKRGEML